MAERTAADAAAVVIAADHLAEVLAPNWDMLGTTWATLGCDEAEAVADLFEACGDQRLADTVIYDHAQGDTEPDDRHHEWLGISYHDFIKEFHR